MSFKKALMSSVALLMTYCKNAKINTGNIGTQVVSDGYDCQVGHNNRYAINYCQPYGFNSIPVDGTQLLVGNLGAGGNNMVALGSINAANENTILQALVEGEASVSSSGGYALVTKKSKIKYLYKGINATACSGEDVQTILIDICQQIENLYAQIGAVNSQLNSHDHIQMNSGRTESMSSSGTTISNSSPDSVIISDKAFCESGKLLIDTNGVTPVR